MFKRTEGKQQDTRQRLVDGSAPVSSTDTAPRIEGRARPAAGKAEEMIAFLNRRNQTRS